MFRLIKLFFPAAWVVVLIFLQLDAHAQVPDYVPADGLIAAFGMNNEVQSAIAPFYTATNADSLSYSFDRNGIRFPESIRRVIASERNARDAGLLDVRIDRCRGQGRGATTYGLASQRRIQWNLGSARPRPRNVHVQNFEGR